MEISNVRKPARSGLTLVRLLTAISRLAVLAIMVALMAVLSPTFFTTSNLLNILRQAAPIFIIAAGQTVVILARGIDLSMDAVASLTGVVMATLMVDNAIPFYVAMPLGLALGALLGLINGLIITKIKLPPFVATFGTWLLFRGLTVLWIDGRVISGFEEGFRFFGSRRLFDIPVIIFIAMLVYLIFRILLKQTTFGRKIYAIGANPAASRVSGINIDRIMIIAFIISALMATFGSQLYISRINSAKSDFGEGFALNAIAATLIGGTSFEGGVGTIEGTVIGALIIILLQNAMNLLGISPYWQGLATGLVIIIAVLGDTFLKKIAKKYES
ncbi:MAG: ABC transporter permease [Coprothermobacterota bacterium]|nr:ABC transporter permease [Coprothermobacterota bacterium]